MHRIPRIEAAIKTLRAVEIKLFSRDPNSQDALRLATARNILIRLSQHTERDRELAA